MLAWAFAALLLIGWGHGSLLITDKGEGISLNLALNCGSKLVEVKSNATGTAFLMYANLIIDRREGNLSEINLSFYGKIPYITKPFTLRIEDKSGASRVVEFDLSSCMGQEQNATVVLLEEIKEQKQEEQKVEKPKEEEKKNKTVQREVPEKPAEEEQ